MVTANAVDQLFKLSLDVDDPAQLTTTRKACTLARDSLDGLLERLPSGKRGRK
jgi:hypothetical protein